MYLQGKISIDLRDTGIKLQPPKNFFGGVANLLTKQSWSTPYQQETFKLMAVAQAVNKILRDSNIDDVIRIAIGQTVVYEDFESVPNDFELAMQKLQREIKVGLDLGFLEKFDLIFQHNDGLLNYIIDFDIYREHEKDRSPIEARFTAVSSELKKEPDETQDEYVERTKEYFSCQEAFDQFRTQAETNFEQFLNKIAEPFKGEFVDEVKIETQLRVVKKEKSVLINSSMPDMGYGSEFYGFDPTYDLYYLTYWHNRLGLQDLIMSDFYYVDPSGDVLGQVTGEGWSSENFNQFDSLPQSDTGSADIDITDANSAGGGWLDSVGDFSGGDFGGDTDSSCGSSCGGCGGGE